MAWYRKIDVRILNDEKFRKLSDDGKLAFFVMLVHPAMTAIGAMRGSPQGLAAELRWIPERFTKAFDEALAKGMAKFDPIACVIWLPNFIKYNAPENPNVLKSWALAIDLLPECDLSREAIQSVKGFAEGLGEPFAQAFAKAFAKAYPKQEQEQEQQQEQVKPKGGEKAAPFVLSGEKVKIVNGSPVTMKTFFERCEAAHEEPVPEGSAVWQYADRAKIPSEFVTLAWKVFVAKYRNNAKRYTDWRTAFLNCVKECGFGLWTVDTANQYALTGKGRQMMKAHGATK